MIMTVVASLVAGVLPVGIAAASAQNAAATPASHYSVTSTPVGKLLDDPAAVLKSLIPTVYANPMFQQDGRALTLKDIQQYESDALSDANLAKIQAEFDKLRPKS
jgi:phage-related minor tail protein